VLRLKRFILPAIAVLMVTLLGGCQSCSNSGSSQKPKISDYLKPPFSVTILADANQIYSQIPSDCNGCNRWFSNIAFRILSEGYLTLEINEEGPVSTTIDNIPPSVDAADILKDHHFIFNRYYKGGVLEGVIDFDETRNIEEWLCPQTLTGRAEVSIINPIRTSDSGGGVITAVFQSSECLTKEPEIKKFKIGFDWTAVLK